MKKLSILILFLAGCSSVEFKQDGPDLYAISVRPDLTREELVEGVCESYFWGSFPRDCVVNFQSEFRNRGVNEPAYVRVGQRHSWANVLATVFTLGIYSPVSYQVALYSKQEMR